MWDTVKKSWNNMPLSTIARAYAGHHQVVNAIIHNNGGNEFLHTKGGLHFGVRKYFLPCEDGSGVQCIPIANDADAPVQEQLVEERKLKFEWLDVGGLLVRRS